MIKFLWLLAVSIFSIFHGTAYASCITIHINKKYIKSRAKTASLICTATLIKSSTAISHDYSPFDDYIKGYPVTCYTFLPNKVWRGKTGDTLVLKTNPKYNDLPYLGFKQKYLLMLESNYLDQCDPLLSYFTIRDKELDKLFQKPRFRRILPPN